jgi:hypothetical protein
MGRERAFAAASLFSSASNDAPDMLLLRPPSPSIHFDVTLTHYQLIVERIIL